MGYLRERKEKGSHSALEGINDKSEVGQTYKREQETAINRLSFMLVEVCSSQ